MYLKLSLHCSSTDHASLLSFGQGCQFFNVAFVATWRTHLGLNTLSISFLVSRMFLPSECKTRSQSIKLKFIRQVYQVYIGLSLRDVSLPKDASDAFNILKSLKFRDWFSQTVEKTSMMRDNFK